MLMGKHQQKEILKGGDGGEKLSIYVKMDKIFHQTILK